MHHERAGTQKAKGRVTGSRHRWGIQSAAITVAAAILLSGPNTSLADDLLPPSWRGSPNSTFQHWHFPPGNAGGGIAFQPDAHNNPFGLPTMAVNGVSFPETEWREEHPTLGREGMWRLQHPGRLSLIIPNFEDREQRKRVRIQWTYLLPVGPVSLDLFGAPIFIVDQEIIQFGDGWEYHMSEFLLEDCPDEVRMTLGPPFGSATYVDQVVVDTICPEPFSAILAMQGIIFFALGRAFYRTAQQNCAN